MTILKNRNFDACTLYILLWLFGEVQGMSFNSSLIAMLFYIPYLGMTLYFVVKAFSSYRFRGVMSALSVFFIVLLLYGVVAVLLDNTKVDKKSFLMMVINNLGPVFSFYYFSRKEMLTEKRMLFWFFVFLVVETLNYFVAQQRALAALAQDLYKYDEITNGAAYYLLGLLPLVFLLKNKSLWQYAIVVYVIYFVISGLKRGAILVSLFMIVWFIYIKTRSSSNIKRIGILLLTIALLAIGWYYVIRFYNTSDYFQVRVEKTLAGSSSNRDVIYSTLWNHYINNDNFLQLVLGEGGYHTVNISRLKAHNDWLELLIDCGILGVIIYLIYWICFIRDWLRNKSNYLVYSMLGACLIFTFLRTLFSMSFCSMPFYISMIMGYCFAQVHEIKNSDLQ